MNYVEVQIGLVVMTEALVVENQTSRRSSTQRTRKAQILS